MKMTKQESLAQDPEVIEVFRQSHSLKESYAERISHWKDGHVQAHYQSGGGCGGDWVYDPERAERHMRWARANNLV